MLILRLGTGSVASFSLVLVRVNWNVSSSVSSNVSWNVSSIVNSNVSSIANSM